MPTLPNRSFVEPSGAAPKLASTRRQFLAGLGVAAAACASGCATGSPPRPEARVGSQLYGWGQYYQREGRPFNVGEVLSALRDAGYDYAEGTLDVARPENNTRFAEELRAKGLRPISYYIGGRFHEEGKSDETVAKTLAAAKVARDAGFSILNCNPDPIGREKTDAELAVQAAALQKLAEGLKQFEVRLGIHHHTPEMRSGAREFHSNFRRTPRALVGFCYDVHWVYRGGVQPGDALRDYADRVVSWHLRQSRDQIWWEDLAEGDIDYASVARYARQHQMAPFYTVELAIESGTRITRSVVENHRRSRDFVRQVFQS